MNMELNSFEADSSVERKEKLDLLEDLEAMNDAEVLVRAWDDVTEILSASLAQGEDAERAQAEALLGDVYQILLEASQSQPELKTYTEELSHLFEKSAAVHAHTEHLLSLDDQSLQEEFGQIEALSLTPEQQRCFDTLILMNKLGDCMISSALRENPSKEPPIVGKLREMNRDIGSAIANVFKSPNPQPSDLLSDEYMNMFRYPEYYFGGEMVSNNAAFSKFIGGGEALPSIDFRNINSDADFQHLNAQVARAMGAVGGYMETALMVAETIPQETLAAAKEAVKNDVIMKVNELKTKTYMNLFNQSAGRVKTEPDLLRRELEQGAEIAGEMARDGLEAQLVLEYLGDQGYTPEDTEMWDVARDMFDVEDELFETSAANMDVFLEASMQIALVSASIVVPELVATAAIAEAAVLGEVAVQILRLNKLKKYSTQAYRIMRAAGLSKNVSKTLITLANMPGRMASVTSHLLLSGAVSEITAQNMMAMAGEADWSDIIDDTPWAMNIIVNAAVSGLFSIPVTRGKWPPSLSEEFTANSASRALISLTRPLFRAGFRPVCAAIAANEIKAGKIVGEEARTYIKLFSNEFYELAQCDDLSNMGS